MRCGARQTSPCSAPPPFSFTGVGLSQVSLLFSTCVKDQLLTGVRFLRDGTSNVAAAAYDSDTIAVWVRT